MANSNFIEKFINKIQKMDARRQLIGGCIVSLFLILFININILTPINEQAGEDQQEIIELQADIASMKSRMEVILRDVEESLANPQSAKSLTYKEQLEQLDTALGKFYTELVSPKEMTTILRELISKNPNLKLISLESLPSLDLFAEESDLDELLKFEGRPKLYKRGVSIKFEASYFDTVAYLKTLEALPKRLFWELFSYTVKEYPIGEVTLTVYTLTTDEGWIGG